MRNLFIVLFLVSFGSVSMGGVGEVYFCETIKSVILHPKKQLQLIDKSEKFKFKLYNSEILFGSENNSFKDFQMAVDPKYRPEKFRAKSSAYTLTFNHGYLVLTKTGWSERFPLTSVGSVMNATCSKS